MQALSGTGVLKVADIANAVVPTGSVAQLPGKYLVELAKKPLLENFGMVISNSMKTITEGGCARVRRSANPYKKPFSQPRCRAVHFALSASSIVAVVGAIQPFCMRSLVFSYSAPQLRQLTTTRTRHMKPPCASTLEWV